ncbi:netrin-4-like [Protopterus annectens]|uniref:netrin-4-like n=1 Tax=Protopterus annectens TaxID=7888 RepID=UPI001CF9D41E|nr:netrin-4-like [Protopterus annectens]
MQHPRGMTLIILLLDYTVSLRFSSASFLKIKSRCVEQSCNPPVGNLATGRTVTTLTTCGQNGTELYCAFTDQDANNQPNIACDSHRCSKCNISQAEYAHLPSSMIDDFFVNPGSWWQSAQGVHQEEIRIDLETEFYLTHVIMVFKSPRPAAMLIERSQDYGKTWKPYKYFAANCTETFGVPDDIIKEDSLCTSRYSSVMPCTRGEVIFRALTSTNKIEDPYTPRAQDIMKLTNLRLLLLKRQECPCQKSRLHGKPQQFAHYAIYDLIIRGSCFCNGHAEDCQPFSGTGEEEKSNESTVMYGKCVCQHNTEGDHCEKCAPLYNDQPWRPGDGKTGAPNKCKKCQCHDHSDRCHFEESVWLATGKQSGGVCDTCKHYTEGRRCQRCKPGFYHAVGEPLSSPQICKSCPCHPLGSKNGTFNKYLICNPRTGYCYCKQGVTGQSCDHCKRGYWGFGENGCQPCDCAGDCDQQTGQCLNSYEPQEQFFNIPVGGRIPDLIHITINESKDDWSWEDEQGFSALRHPEKCVCKEKMLEDATDFCKMKYAYVIKARILSAHDKGTHAEVIAKVKKILKKGKLKITQGTTTIYPESWTNRGCTCPVLNPGTDYLIAGHEDLRNRKLLVRTNSLVKPWKTTLGKQISELFQTRCK